MKDWSRNTNFGFALAAGAFVSIVSVVVVWIGTLFGLFDISSGRKLAEVAGAVFGLTALTIVCYFIDLGFWIDDDRDVM